MQAVLLNPFEPTIRKGAAGKPDASKPADPVADHSYGNPVNAHLIFLKMANNFPPAAIEWVKRATWEGPVEIAWDNIDTNAIKGWAASKQPERVKEFQDKIRMHHGDVEPSILIKDNDTPKSIIIDGHHRALARHNMNMPVLSYVGRINPADRQTALETHSKQIHGGASPQNKNMDDLLAKLEGFWYRQEIGLPVNRREVFKVLTELRDAGRDERLLSLQAGDFGWSVEQLDNQVLRTWLCAV